VKSFRTTDGVVSTYEDLLVLWSCLLCASEPRWMEADDRHAEFSSRVFKIRATADKHDESVSARSMRASRAWAVRDDEASSDSAYSVMRLKARLLAEQQQQSVPGSGEGASPQPGISSPSRWGAAAASKPGNSSPLVRVTARADGQPESSSWRGQRRSSSNLAVPERQTRSPSSPTRAYEVPVTRALRRGTPAMNNRPWMIANLTEARAVRGGLLSPRAGVARRTMSEPVSVREDIANRGVPGNMDVSIPGVGGLFFDQVSSMAAAATGDPAKWLESRESWRARWSQRLQQRTTLLEGPAAVAIAASSSSSASSPDRAARASPRRASSPRHAAQWKPRARASENAIALQQMKGQLEARRSSPSQASLERFLSVRYVLRAAPPRCSPLPTNPPGAERGWAGRRVCVLSVCQSCQGLDGAPTPPSSAEAAMPAWLLPPPGGGRRRGEEERRRWAAASAVVSAASPELADSHLQLRGALSGGRGGSSTGGGAPAPARTRSFSAIEYRRLDVSRGEGTRRVCRRTIGSRTHDSDGRFPSVAVRLVCCSRATELGNTWATACGGGQGALDPCAGCWRRWCAPRRAAPRPTSPATHQHSQPASQPREGAAGGPEP
jgi:hypothetical protein